MTRSFILATVAVSTLAACGGGGLGGPITTPAQREYTARLNDADALTRDIRANQRFFLSDGNMPSRGSAVYQGFAEIVIDTPRGDTSLLGDAVLTADFADRDMDGTLGNFVGSVNGDAVREYSGQLLLNGGIPNRGNLDPANWGTTMSGQLRSGLNQVIIAGGMGGDFRTDRQVGGQPNAIFGDSTSGTTFTVLTPTLNQTFNNRNNVNEVEVFAQQ